jgi:uncharacterized SAM-binding protein YcdF (DUF218 family)
MAKRSIFARPLVFERRFCGFLTRRECWCLSWRARLLLCLLVLTAAILYVQHIQHFLAPTRRVNTRILVVEGWVPEYVIRAAVSEFQNGNYEMVYATGGPIAGSGGSTNDFETSASVGADLLKKYGVVPDKVQMVPAHAVRRDRTYSSAVALRDWFQQHDLMVTSFNLLTEDVHSRRSQLLFQRAFGSHVAIGIIAIPDPDYDARHWWRYSEGVREIVGESIAYLYAALFFKPPPS